MAYLVGQYAVDKVIYTDLGKHTLEHKTIPVKDLGYFKKILEVRGYTFEEVLSDPEFERYVYSLNGKDGELMLVYIEYEEIEVEDGEWQA